VTERSIILSGGRESIRCPTAEEAREIARHLMTAADDFDGLS
jgi:hypothetical protein